MNYFTHELFCHEIFLIYVLVSWIVFINVYYRAIIKMCLIHCGYKTYILTKLNFIEVNMEKTFIILKHICIFRYIHLPSVEY
jgi:hypothetical protein